MSAKTVVAVSNKISLPAISRNNKRRSLKGELCACLMLLFLFLLPAYTYAHENILVHPYITEEAFRIWPKSESHEIYQYLNYYYGYRSTSTEDQACIDGKSGRYIAEGAKEEDDYTPLTGGGICNSGWNLGAGYYHHFYDPDISEPFNGLFEDNGYNSYGSFHFAQAYWTTALKYYKAGDKDAAYWYLGRIAHLLADASVPAHVNRDAHANFARGTGTDDYENYMSLNYDHWNANTLDLSKIPEAWGLSELFLNLAQRSQYYPSDDINGNTDFQSDSQSGCKGCYSKYRYDIHDWEKESDTAGWNDWWNTTNLDKIGNRLMPLAFQYTAALYKLFWNETHGILTGKVYKAQPYSPISNARVDLYGPHFGIFATAYTDQNGAFTFADLEPASYYVKVSKSEYDEATSNTLLQAQFSTRASNTLNAIYLTPVNGSLPPTKPKNPNPVNNLSEQSINSQLSWTDGGGATSYDVYFGTTNPPASKGNQTITSYNPGTLANNKTYYWRIDAKNANGTTTGDIWHFTTGSQTAQKPQKAINPNPANLAAGQSISKTLSWANGGGATSYNVYFGTSNPPASKGNQSYTTYNPGTLAYNTTYYWRIDAVNTDGPTTGDIWSFTTGSQPLNPPQKAITPNPSNGAANQTLSGVTFSWANGGGATSYKVHFGTSSTLTSGNLKSSQSSTTYNTGALNYDTIYYWRIDSVNTDGTTTGDVWHFTAEKGPWNTFFYWDFDTEDAEGWTGRNSTVDGVFSAEYLIVNPTPDAASKSGILSPDGLTSIHTNNYNALEVRAAAINTYIPYLEAYFKINNNWTTSPVQLNYVSGSQVANSQVVYRGNIPYNGQIQQARVDFVWGSNSIDDRVYIDYVKFSNWSDATTPTVTIGAPYSGEQIILNTGKTVQFSATDNTAVHHIDVQLSLNGGSSYSDIMGCMGLPGTATSCVFVAPSLTNTAMIKVAAYDAVGNSGYQTVGFKIVSAPTCSGGPAVPNLYDPGSYTEQNSYSFSWQTISDAKNYILRESTSSSFTTYTDYTYTGADMTTASFTGKSNGFYYYKIKSHNDCGDSSWSNTIDIEVRVNAAPNVPSNPNPANGAAGVSRTPTLSWSGGGCGWYGSIRDKTW